MLRILFILSCSWSLFVLPFLNCRSIYTYWGCYLSINKIMYSLIKLVVLPCCSTIIWMRHSHRLKGQIVLPWLMLAYVSLLLVDSWVDVLEEGTAGRWSPGKTWNSIPAVPNSCRLLSVGYKDIKTSRQTVSNGNSQLWRWEMDAIECGVNFYCCKHMIVPLIYAFIQPCDNIVLGS